MSDARFIDGLIVKAPHERAPEYVKAKLSIKREELIAWLQQQDGEWINAEIKVSQGGKYYAAVDDWKPEREGGDRASRPDSRERPASAPTTAAPQQQPAGDFHDDDIPF